MSYYHITSKENVNKILKEGLIPQIGTNSSLCGVKTPYVYLCERKDVPYWKIILGETEVLHIDLPKEVEEQLEQYEYAAYQEFFLTSTIPAEYIQKCRHNTGMKQAMEELCSSYIYTIGDICVEIAKHCTLRPEDIEEKRRLVNEVNSTLKTLYNLDFSCLSPKEIRDIIKDSGDGRYAFTDYYRDENIKLYRKISMFRDEILTEPASRLTAYICKTFPKCLRLQTGGWG